MDLDKLYKLPLNSFMPIVTLVFIFILAVVLVLVLVFVPLIVLLTASRNLYRLYLFYL